MAMQVNQEDRDTTDEVFRKVWKHFKRSANSVASYLLEDGSNPTLIDFANLENSPLEYTKYVKDVSDTVILNKEFEDLTVKQVFGIKGRPGFYFIPNPFKSVEIEALWTRRLALDYATGPMSRRNHDTMGEKSALDEGLRWATLGFHYDWKKREYRLSDRTSFPNELTKLAQDICASVGDSIVPETAIINYYRKNMRMGGHKDDAEWTDEAPVVSISFGNAGVYVLGGDCQTDAGPPPPIPLIVRSGDVVLLGGHSRMNIHGAPCLLKNTFPKPLARELAKVKNGPELVKFMNITRVNVNVRQVQSFARRLVTRFR